MAYQLLIPRRKFNQDYQGPAERCTYEFATGPEQFIDEHAIVQAYIDELAKEGSIILEFIAWWDPTPTFTTNFHIEVTASASPIAWVLIFWAVVGILAIIGTILILHKIEDIAEYLGPGAFGNLMTYATIGVIALATLAGMYLVRRKT